MASPAGLREEGGAVRSGSAVAQVDWGTRIFNLGGWKGGGVGKWSQVVRVRERFLKYFRHIFRAGVDS